MSHIEDAWIRLAGRLRADRRRPQLVARRTQRTRWSVQGAGELEVVKTLLDHGADLSATDPEFHATPLQWAEFLRRPRVAEYLIERV